MKGEKFLEFENYLKNSKDDYIELSFEQIERIIGQKLCKSAYQHIQYWYLSPTHTFPITWINAGYQMENLDLKGQQVIYKKVSAIVITTNSSVNEINTEPSASIKRKRPQIDIDFAISKADEFFKNLSTENSRYLSWEHCYTAFAECKELKDDNINNLCLHLAFYLASWGMYRGSSFLLQKDYLVHIDAVKELYNQKYKSLWGISCNDLLTEGNLDLLFELFYRLKEIYIEKRKKLDDYDDVSVILITKILMGTLGCVPAYDTYFIATIRAYKVASGNLNKRSLGDLALFYNENREKLDDFKRKLFINREVNYTEMKILDMAFWYISYEKDLKKKNKHKRI